MNGNETLLCCNCRGLTRYCRVQLTVRKYARNNMTVPRIFESLVKKHPDRVCFIFEDTKWTFREVCSLYFIYIYIYKDIDICKRILKKKFKGRVAEGSALRTAKRGVSGSIPAQVKTFFFEGIEQYLIELNLNEKLKLIKHIYAKHKHKT